MMASATFASLLPTAGLVPAAPPPPPALWCAEASQGKGLPCAPGTCTGTAVSLGKSRVALFGNPSGRKSRSLNAKRCPNRRVSTRATHGQPSGTPSTLCSTPSILCSTPWYPV